MRRLVGVLLLAAVPGCQDSTGPAAADRFTIELRFLTETPLPVRFAMRAAKARWEEAIVGKLPPVAVDSAVAAQFCGVHEPVPVDDLLVLVRVQFIDGPGGINALQGTCLSRGPGHGILVPLVAFVIFDVDNVSALVANGHLLDVAIHEIGHALGFNSLDFDRNGCLQDRTIFIGTAPVPADTHFSCPRGRWVFDSLGGAGYHGGAKVPLENCALEWDPPCIPGRANSHWREVVAFNEVMSTYLNVGVPGVLSRLTLAALEDIGHQVDYRAAGEWFVPPSAVAAGTTLYLGDDVVFDRPVGVLDARGKLVRTLLPEGGGGFER